MDNLTAAGTINALALSIIGGCYLLMFSLQLVLWNRIERCKKEIGSAILKAANDINQVAAKNKRAIELTSKRLDVLDRVASAVADSEFSSESVGQGLQEPPNTTVIRKILGDRKEGSA